MGEMSARNTANCEKKITAAYPTVSEFIAPRYMKWK